MDRKAYRKNFLENAMQPGFLSVTLWFFFSGGTRIAFQGLWGGVYFTGPLGYTDGQNGILLMLISLGCIAGAMLLGRVADRFGSLRTLVWSGWTLPAVWMLLLFFAPCYPSAFWV
jgi:MFS-type transporter involved in bile tolerance (Atg22 family)